MFKKLALIAFAFAVAAFAVVAQEPPPPPPPMPGLMIPLPDGVMSPLPEDGPEAFEAFLADVFALIDANGDGVVSLEELKAWMKKFEPPMDEGGEGGSGTPPEEGGSGMPPEEGGSGMPPEEGDLSTLPDPPPCDDALFTSEMGPQDTNVPCGSQEGNLVFRTVCNTEGYNSQAISLPAGRMASCFGIEAITKNKVAFVIYHEAEPGGMIYDSERDGLENIGAVELVADEGDAVYRVEIDTDVSDPDARVTVRFNDHPME